MARIATRNVSVDQLRALWTVGTLFGSVVMLFLTREAIKDEDAVRLVARPGTEVLRLYLRGEVWDHTLLMLTLLALFLAGMLSYLGLSAVVIPLLVLSAGLLVFLGVMKSERRRRMFRSVKRNRKPQEG